MPDCSYVTLTIANEYVNDQLRQLLDAATHWTQEGPAPNDAPATVWESDEESWGADNASLTSLYDWLVAAQVPFRATDGGHYTWPPFEIGYNGQTPKWIYRSHQLDGGPSLSTWELAVIAHLDPEAFKDAVLAHFDDDPAGWANNHAA